jgi:hypothetical protein
MAKWGSQPTAAVESNAEVMAASHVEQTFDGQKCRTDFDEANQLSLNA